MPTAAAARRTTASALAPGSTATQQRPPARKPDREGLTGGAAGGQARVVEGEALLRLCDGLTLEHAKLEILRAEAEACSGGGGGPTMSASGGGGGVARPAPAAPSGASIACMRLAFGLTRRLTR